MTTYTLKGFRVAKETRRRARAVPAPGAEPWHTAHKTTRYIDKWIDSVNVEVTIDVDKLCRLLANRAALNKSGKTGMVGGLIKAKVTATKQATDVETREIAAGSGYVWEGS